MEAQICASVVVVRSPVFPVVRWLESIDYGPKRSEEKERSVNQVGRVGSLVVDGLLLRL